MDVNRIIISTIAAIVLAFSTFMATLQFQNNNELIAIKVEIKNLKEAFNDSAKERYTSKDATKDFLALEKAIENLRVRVSKLER